MAVAEALCAERGQRLTPIRRKVLGTLLASHKPLGAYEIIDQLAPRGPRPAPITAYRALELSGYARIDLRMDDAGHVWVLEANPNPQIAKGEDFAASAEKVGMSYEAVLQRIVNLGLRWQPESVA